MFFIQMIFVLIWIKLSTSLEIDSNGYIAYCPCLGRFGNQAEQFLGSLHFAKSINRTLIVPPWIEYRNKMTPVPFDTYFSIEALKEYHRVITMETFMKQLAPEVWPPEKRVSFCGRSKHDKKNCETKVGNPFGPFWDSFEINFVQSEHYNGVFNIRDQKHAKKWKEGHPGDEFPVLAFKSPPAQFPALESNHWLQRFIKWSHEYEQKAEDFIKTKIIERPFLGIHLRNGRDFEKACKRINSEKSKLFASAQCTGNENEKGNLTQEICFPSDQTTIDQVKQEVKQTKVKTVFVASDNRHLIEEFSAEMPQVKFVKQSGDPSPHLDLAVLGKADYFIGNCVSTFTAFVKRERDSNNLPSSFWAFKPKDKHDEL